MLFKTLQMKYAIDRSRGPLRVRLENSWLSWRRRTLWENNFENWEWQSSPFIRRRSTMKWYSSNCS